jgi:pyridoxine/pyridoxamine 5'-phosphate oxidase
VPPDLAAGLDRVWQRLAAAVADRSSPWRTPVVATAGADGPDGRVMVLRGVDRTTAALTFFTDRRAAKAAAIAAAPAVVVVGYDPAERLQLRLRGRATIDSTGPAADAAWAALSPDARNAYRTAASPGSSAASSPVAARLDGDGRATFARLIVTVAGIDVLDLAGPVHRRARYRRAVAGWTATWCVP